MKLKYILPVIFFLFPIMTYAETINVTSYNDLKTAIENGKTDIIMSENMEFDSSITITNEIRINGNGKSLNRATDYKGNLFTIKTEGTLTIQNLKIDLGAPGWKMDYENRYYTQPNNKGYIRVPVINGENDNIANASVFKNSGNLTLENTEIKNGRSTESGTLISGAGNNTLNSVTINHIHSNKNGGAIYQTAGNLYINNLVSKEISVGLPNSSPIPNGATLYIINGNELKINGATIEENFAQGNGAVFISKTNTEIEDITFRKNKVGNDGSTLSLESQTESKKFILNNGIFEDNIGYAVTGQSMGTIWLSKWISTPEEPIVFKNVKFRNNINRCGGAIADSGAGVSHVRFENVEVTETNGELQTGGFIYTQNATYTIINAKVHDNHLVAGGAIYSLVSPITIIDSEFYNNQTEKAGGAINLNGGDVVIKNTTITNNTSATLGGGVYYRSYYDGYPLSLTINNTIIKDNNADSGGGLAMTDNEGFYTNLNVDDQSKIYDNSAITAGDDFRYVRNDQSENNTNNSLTLNNLNLAGILGIDGWYKDDEGSRFAIVENPEKFDDYVGYKGIAITLKSAGVNTLDYNLNGGNSNDINSITVKYGVDTPITDEVPEKVGYIFEGWNTAPDGSGQTILPGTTYNGKAGLTLYAQYRFINPETKRNSSPLNILILSIIIGLGSIKTLKKKIIKTNNN